MRQSLTLILLLIAPIGCAQFTVVGPAPYTEPVAREKIRTSLENVEANHQKETIDTLTGLLTWYRDLIDDELVTAWQKESDKRLDLSGVIDTLATPRVASGIMEFSWRERGSAFRIAYAPLYEHLMTRYLESGKPMLDDLLAHPLDLPEPVAETVCRILIDMPEQVGNWRKSALRILPRYRATAKRLLAQDLRSSDSAKRDIAEFWLEDPRSTLYDGSASSDARSTPPRLARRSSGDPNFAGSGPDAPPPTPPPAGRPTLAHAPQTETYSGPRSGTLECSGAPVPQNAEYVFRNLPAAKLQLDYDTRIWDARLVPVDAQSQKLVLRNKAAGAQKHCTVHWTVAP